MRITGGKLKGREVRTADTHRPTKDQVRLAVFNTLASRVEGARVADLFAGSGAVGLEAWSRGAAEVAFVENDRAALAALDRNLRTLGADAPPGVLHRHGEDALAWLARRKGRADLNILFADPPYTRNRDDDNLADQALTAADELEVLAPGGVLVLELHERQPLHQPRHLRPFFDRTYGMTRVVMCMRDSPAGEA